MFVRNKPNVFAFTNHFIYSTSRKDRLTLRNAKLVCACIISQFVEFKQYRLSNEHFYHLDQSDIIVEIYMNYAP